MTTAYRYTQQTASTTGSERPGTHGYGVIPVWSYWCKLIIYIADDLFISVSFEGLSFLAIGFEPRDFFLLLLYLPIHIVGKTILSVGGKYYYNLYVLLVKLFFLSVENIATYYFMKTSTCLLTFNEMKLW